MDNPRKQPDAPSRQAVGVLMGALVGFGVAAWAFIRHSEYRAETDFVWTGLFFTVVGGVVGLLIATLMNSQAPPEEQVPHIPAEVESVARARFNAGGQDKGKDGPKGQARPGGEGTMHKD